MRLGADMCYGCFVSKHPEVLEAREIAKEKRKKAQKEYARKKRLESKVFRKKAKDSANKEN